MTIRVGPYELESEAPGQLTARLRPSSPEIKRYRAWARKPRGRSFVFESEAALQVIRADEDEGPTVRDHRDNHTNSYAGALALLAISLRDRRISPHEYQQQAEALWTSRTGGLTDTIAGHYGADPEAVTSASRRLIGQFRDSNELGAAALGTRALDKTPSNSQLQAGATAVAGLMWAASHVIEAAAIHNSGDDTPIIGVWNCVNDDASCEHCIALDGQEWPLEEIPEWPGDGNQTCFGNCRCALEFDSSGAK